MNIVVFGLSLSSSWGNGHATTYRGLLRALANRGHRIVFYERDVPWYAAHRDLPASDFCTLKLYETLAEIDGRDLAAADVVVVGSFVKETDAIVDQVLSSTSALIAFYDIDTPVTVAKLEAGDKEFLSLETVPLFDRYLSFSGGPILERLAAEFGVRDVRLLGCSADTRLYKPLDLPRRYALGYLGTYDESRQPALDRLLLEPARRMPDRRFVVAGPQYPADIDWPANVERIDHLPPDRHAEFYGSLDFAINVTRSHMVEAGYSPSVRIFEAAACRTAVITDSWAGLEAFFTPGRDILVADTADQVTRYLGRPDAQREAVAEAGYQRVLAAHSASVRAAEFEQMVRQARAGESLSQTAGRRTG